MICKVCNKRSFDCVREVVSIHVSFPQGLCPGEDRIAVEDMQGNEIPCQWEGGRTVRFQDEQSVGRYADGSLRHGSILFIDSIPCFQFKTYDIKIREKGKTAPAVTYDAEGGTFSAGRLSCRLDARTKLPVSVTVDGEEKSIRQQLRIYGADGRILEKKALPGDFKVSGTGAVFKEAESTLLFGEDFSATCRLRLYVNDHITFTVYYKALREIAAGAVCGMENALLGIPATTECYCEENRLSTCCSWQEHRNTVAAGVLFAHGDKPRTDPFRPEYPAFSHVTHGDGVCNVAAGWRYGENAKVFPIPRGEVFASGLYLDYSIDNRVPMEPVTGRVNKVIPRLAPEKEAQNQAPLVSRLPMGGDSRHELGRLLRDILVRVGGHFYEKYYRTKPREGELFSVACGANLLLAELTGAFPFSQAVDDLDRMCRSFGADRGGDAMYEMFVKGELVFQLTSRLFPYARLGSMLCRRRGDERTAEKLNGYLRAYAQMTCRIVEDRGFTPLWYALPDYNSNAIGAGMRALAMGLEIESGNERWKNAFYANKEHFRPFMRYCGSIVTDDPDTNAGCGQYLHYALFALNEYARALRCLNLRPDIPLTQYGWASFSAQGAAKEQNCCISSSRRGVPHTNAYQISLLAMENTKESIAEACAVARHLQEQINADGSHVFPLEGWRYEPSQTYEGAVPFELGVLAEVLGEL